MSELAWHKYDESRFFLDKMREAEGSDFEYYLSAFLTAGRTITLALQSEYSENNEFEQWYSKKQEKMDDDSLFDFMNNLRNRVAHPNDTYPDPKEWPGVKTWPLALDEPPRELEKEDRVRNVSTTGYEYVRYRFPEESHEVFDEYNSYTVCKLASDYLQRLEEMLKEWDRKRTPK